MLLNELLLKELEKSIIDIEYDSFLTPLEKRLEILSLLKKYKELDSPLLELFSSYRKKRKKYDTGFSLFDFLSECLLTRMYFNPAISYILLLNTFSKEEFLSKQRDFILTAKNEFII